jgi:hypothetical protein
MDKNKSAKLTGLITKLTLAANKAAKKNDSLTKAALRSVPTDLKFTLKMSAYNPHTGIPMLLER